MTAQELESCADCGRRGGTHRHDCAAAQGCGCGYDLCGECMRSAHDGERPPARHMVVPGLRRVGDPT